MRTVWRPFRPILSLVSLSSSRECMASASFKGSFAGTRIPFSPLWMTSGIPPTGVAITGFSHASASRTVSGRLLRRVIGEICAHKFERFMSAL